jgi:hypothetical protein
MQKTMQNYKSVHQIFITSNKFGIYWSLINWCRKTIECKKKYHQILEFEVYYVQTKNEFKKNWNMKVVY